MVTTPYSIWVPLIGVIVGFLLSQVANTIMWILSSRREKQLVRLIVALEIDQNLGLLKDYWHNVSLPPDEEDDPPKVSEIEANRLARRAVLIPLPILSDAAFKSQLGALPKALGESSIRSTWQIYEEFAQVKNIHDWLLQITNATAIDHEVFPNASRAIKSEGFTSAVFTTKKAGAIYDLRVTINALLNASNPLVETSLRK